MKKIYLLAYITLSVIVFNPFKALSQATDSVKVASTKLNFKEGKEDNNYITSTTDAISETSDVAIKVSISDFNLTASQIEKAEFRIYFKSPTSNGNIVFYEMDADWDPTTITWNIAQTFSVASSPFDTLNVDQSEDSWYYVDMTDSIKAKVAAGKDFSWLLKSNDGTNATMRTSAHIDAIYQPTLLLTQKTTSAGKIRFDNEFIVYPNPSHGQISVRCNKTINGIAKLFDTTGKELINSNFDSNTIQLDATHVNAGIYFLTVEADNEIIGREKVIIR